MKTSYSALRSAARIPALGIGALSVLAIAFGAIAFAPSFSLADSNTTDFSSFTAGSVNGQDGWTETNASYDQAIVDSSAYDLASTSAITGNALRISDAVTSGGFDWVYAAPLTNAVGEASSTDGSFSEGTKATHFETEFDIATAASSTATDGMHISVSPDRGDGSRMSYLRFEYRTADNKIHVFFDDVAPGGSLGTAADFRETDIASLDPSTSHHVKLTLDAVDGPSNDVVDVYIDGSLIHSGTSWEDYYRFDPEASAEQTPRIIKTVIFQARGTAAPADQGNGFLIDNVSLTSGGTAGPVVTNPSITSTPVTTGLVGSPYTYDVTTSGTPGNITASGLPAGVTITDNGNGTATISGTPTTAGSYSVIVTDSNASGSATQPYTLSITPAAVWVDSATGSDTSGDGTQAHPYATIQKGLASVNAGGTVNVDNGAYTGAITIADSNVSLVGQSEGGVTVSLNSGTSYGQGVSIVGATGDTISNISFNVPAGAPISYALQANKADGLILTNDSFIGPGATSTHIGGVDSNTTNNVSYTNVTSSGFYKNGFSFTPSYLSTDPATDGITLNNITSSNNGWTGISFYTVGNDHSPSSIGGSHSFSHVTFSGTNTVSGNGTGIFIEGDSDANVNASSTAPVNTVTSDGTTLDLSTVAFNGNTTDDIYNYQTAPVNAVGATFEGSTGTNMTSAQQAAEDAKIIDSKDDAALGTVTYIAPAVVSSGGGGGNVDSGSGQQTSGSGGGSTVVPAGTPVTTTTGTGTGEVLGASTFNFTTDLTVGSTGDAVTALQQILINDGYLQIAAPTGTFGPLTQAAVAAFQAAHGITPAVGYVGPITRALLDTGTITTADQEAHAMLVAKINEALADVVSKLLAIQAILNARGN